MANLVIQHALQAENGLAEDRYVNTFHVTTLAEPIGTDLAAIRDAIIDFYKPAENSGLQSFMGKWANGIGRTVKIYDLADLKPRAPIHEFISTTPPFSTASTTKNMPAEVAVCLSYEGDKISGTPQARRRGRIYIGPLSDSVMNESTASTPSRPMVAFLDLLLVQAAVLKLDLFAAGAVWCVYSPTEDSAGDGSQGMTPITSIWVDDAYDTQRRRGIAASQKRYANMAG